MPCRVRIGIYRGFKKGKLPLPSPYLNFQNKLLVTKQYTGKYQITLQYWYSTLDSTLHILTFSENKMITDEISEFLKTEFIDELQQNEVKVEIIDTKQDYQESFR